MIPALTCTIDPAAADSGDTGLLVLGPSLGTTTTLWREASRRLGILRPGLRRLRFDLPGHGASRATREPFSFADLADAVIAAVDATGGGRFHYAGVSLGGAIGIELALRHPQRLLSLTIIASDARIGSPEGWAERAVQTRTQGTASLVTGSASRWFAPGFAARDSDSSTKALIELTEIDDESYALAAEALGAFDRRADLTAITVPTSVIAGWHDVVTTPDSLTLLAGALGTSLTVLEDAAHLPPLEQPEQVAELIDAALGESGDARYARGMVNRRQILGDAHVDASIARTTPETAAFQQFITRYAWGEVWNREELSRRERSIATLASLVTGGHENELAMHVRAARRNGLTDIEISEVIMHTAIYAGLPAANSAFAIARAVFAETEEPGGTDG